MYNWKVSKVYTNDYIHSTEIYIDINNIFKNYKSHMF
jgi:hypothetical protein